MPFDRELANLILETLQDGVPFIALAAEKHGVKRQDALAWIEQGDLALDGPVRAFALGVRSIRAKYLLHQAQTLDRADNPKEAMWLMQRLDRDLFDPPKADAEPMHVKGKQLAPDHRLVRNAVEDLAKPQAN